jgi:WD40 repeat protein
VAGVNVHDGPGWIVSFDERREVRIWDGTTHRRLRTLQGLDPDRFFPAPLLDARGTFLAWQSLRERAFPLWDLAGPPDAGPLLLRKSEVTGDTGWGAFLPDGRWLATALGSRVAFWPLRVPWPRVIRVGSSSDVAFTPDSRQLVSCGVLETRIYPVTPDAPAARPIRWQGDFTCYGLAMDPSGGHVLLAAAARALLLTPLDGGEALPLVRVPPTESITAVASDAKGRWAATAAVYAPDVRDRVLHVVDLRTGDARTFPLPGAEGEHASSGGVAALAFASEGRLLSAGLAGLRRWDPETGRNEVLHPPPCGPMATSADGRRIVVGCKAERPAPGAGAASDELRQPPFELLLIDTSTGERRRIGTHGTDIGSLALDPSGEVLATGDSAGTVRVGRVDGSEPHLLVGAGGVVLSLAFSPDGRWIASTAGNDIRLWPMPDLSRPPLHTLPHDALLAKLDSLTNVRVVEDPAAPTAYKVEIGPFPGWKDVPTW